MSDKEYAVLGGAYASEQDANKDYIEVGFAYEQDVLGPYEVAIFKKTDDGKVDIINTQASKRGAGAAAGAAVGGVATAAVIGLMFPFALSGGVLAGAAAGAVVGDLTKAFSRGDVRKMGEALDAGQFAVVAVAEIRNQDAAAKILSHAAQSEVRPIPDAKAVHHYLKDAD